MNTVATIEEFRASRKYLSAAEQTVAVRAGPRDTYFVYIDEEAIGGIYFDDDKHGWLYCLNTKAMNWPWLDVADVFSKPVVLRRVILAYFEREPDLIKRAIDAAKHRLLLHLGGDA